MIVGVIAIVRGFFWLLMWVERASRQRIERRRKA